MRMLLHYIYFYRFGRVAQKDCVCTGNILATVVNVTTILFSSSAFIVCKSQLHKGSYGTAKMYIYEKYL